MYTELLDALHLDVDQAHPSSVCVTLLLSDNPSRGSMVMCRNSHLKRDPPDPAGTAFRANDVSG